MNTVWHISKEGEGLPLLDLGPHGESPQERQFTFPGPGTYRIACTTINRNEQFRADYWGEHPISCNTPSGCYTTTGEALLIIPGADEECTENDGGRNHNVRGTTRAGAHQRMDHIDAYARGIEYFCNTNGHLTSDTRDTTLRTRPVDR